MTSKVHTTSYGFSRATDLWAENMPMLLGNCSHIRISRTGYDRLFIRLADTPEEGVVLSYLDDSEMLNMAYTLKSLIAKPSFRKITL